MLFHGVLLVIKRRKFQMKKIFLFLFLSFFIASYAQASTCSLASPCTLTTGLGKVVAGDTLYLRGGSYNQVFSLTTNGTSANPITVSGYSGETAIIDGTNTLPTGGCYSFLVTLGGNYEILQNVQVQNSYGGGIILSGNYNKLMNVYCVHTVETGIVSSGSNNLIHGCTMTQNGQGYPAQCSTWGGAIALFAGSNNTIEQCLSHDNVGEGLASYGSATYSTIQDSISYNNAVGVYLDSTQHALAQRNLVYVASDNPSPSANGLISIGAETAQPSDITVINNFVYGGYMNLQVDSNVTSMVNILIANNTFVNSIGDAGSGYNMGVYFRSQLTSNTNSFFENNIVEEDVSGRVPISIPSTHTGLTLSNNNWSKTPVSAASGTGDVVGVPLITKGPTTAGALTGNYFTLTASSPGLQKAAVLTAVTVDFFNNARGTTPDIGGDQFSTSGSSGGGGQTDINTPANYPPAVNPSSSAKLLLDTGPNQGGANADGLVSIPLSYFQQALVNPITTLYRSGTRVSHTGNTNETILLTIPVAANSMGVNSQIALQLGVSGTVNSNNKTYKVYFGPTGSGLGGTLVATSVMTTSPDGNGTWFIGNRGSLTSQVATGTLSGAFTSSNSITSSVNTLNSCEINISGQLATSTDTIAIDLVNAQLMP
jgi:hypothetical protein